MSKSNIYVGIDLHKRKFTYVMLSATGKEMSRGTRSTDQESIAEFASGLIPRHQVVIEPVENSHWFSGQLAPYAGSIHMANPYRVRLIAESRLKSDQVDARILADLLRVGYLPTVYLPSPQIQQWRLLTSHRIRLARDRARLKHRIAGLLNREGHRLSATDSLGKSGRAELDSLSLSPPLRRMVDTNLVMADLLTRQIAALDTEIAAEAKTDAVVGLLQTIDGIGPFIALAIRAAVGEMSRFHSPKAFAAYTGLIPSCRQSADTVHTGPITKQGSGTLRWVLTQAAGHAVRRNDRLKRLHQRICFRGSAAKARVAVAHALARIIYHVWTEARPYYR